MVKKYVKKEIDKTIKSIWLNEICNEYGEGDFLLEASLQCSLYHHLRSKLEPLFEDNNLHIYPEFTFPALGYRADLVICEMDMEIDSNRLKDKLSDIAAIIELKYGGSPDYIKTDIPKFKTYIQSLGFECQYYFGSIDERTECGQLCWLDKRSTNHWASGYFTELNAGFQDGAMYFEVNSYNGMNLQNKKAICDFLW